MNLLLRKRLLVLWSLLIGVFWAGPVTAQHVEVVVKTGFQYPAQTKQFIFWEPATDTAALRHIATLRITGVGPDAQIEPLFDRIKAKAQQLGANAFRPVDFDATTHRIRLILNIYTAPEDAIGANTQNQERQVIYVFGQLHATGKATAFQLNGLPMNVPARAFYRYAFENSQDLTIGKGETTLRFHPQKGDPALFLLLSGFAAAPASMGGGSGLALEPADWHRSTEVWVGCWLRC
ncbi:MAG: hypothetical protein EOP52_02615 [Sphingobacteriales bacterium]|nr:MAG: hypothetical protein EOP52_02615 [Sphingobacteriales bacterium]